MIQIIKSISNMFKKIINLIIGGICLILGIFCGAQAVDANSDMAFAVFSGVMIILMILAVQFVTEFIMAFWFTK